VVEEFVDGDPMSRGDGGCGRFTCDRVRPGAFAALSILGVLGCHPGAETWAPQDPLIHDSAGIEIVENLGSGLWPEGDGWSLSSRAQLEIGAAEGDSGVTLFRVTGAVRLSDGQVVIANGGMSELLFFSPRGQLVAKAGGAGAGPGEFTTLFGLAKIMLGSTAGDTVLAYDWAGSKIMAFSPTGAFINSTPLRDGVDGGIRLASGIGWIEEGSFLATTTSYGEDSHGRLGPDATLIRPRLVLRRFDVEGMLGDTIGFFPGDERVTSLKSTLDETGSGTVEVGMAPVPFGRTFHAVAGANTVAVGVTDKREVRFYASDGVLRRIVRGPGGLVSITEADREAWIESQGGREPAAPFPKTMPAFASLALDAEGRLWVEKYRPPGSPEGSSRWNVYDDKGRLLGEVEMPDRFQPMEIGTDYILGVWKDALDVEHVHLYDLHAGQPPRERPLGGGKRR